MGMGTTFLNQRGVFYKYQQGSVIKYREGIVYAISRECAFGRESVIKIREGM